MPTISSSDSVAKIYRRSEAAAIQQGGKEEECQCMDAWSRQAFPLQWGCSVTPGCQARGNGFKEHLY